MRGGETWVRKGRHWKWRFHADPSPVLRTTATCFSGAGKGEDVRLASVRGGCALQLPRKGAPDVARSGVAPRTVERKRRACTLRRCSRPPSWCTRPPRGHQRRGGGLARPVGRVCGSRRGRIGGLKKESSAFDTELLHGCGSRVTIVVGRNSLKMYSSSKLRFYQEQ